MKYYDLANILKKNARYNIVFGERSNGKTYSVLEYGVKEYFKSGKQMAVIRRWREDFKGKRGAAYFDNLVCNGNQVNKVKELSKGKYDHVTYQSGRWYFAYYDDELEKYVTSPEPFAYAFALTEMEHEKGNSYPLITTVLFDEFMSRGMYVPDEFVLFMNTLSTIIRHRDNVKVFMAANTVDMIGCPYFKEMGLKHVKEMTKGDIDVYEYGTSGLRVAVEYSDSPNKEGKPSDVYFAFDNQKLRMITSGAFELDIYPHLQKGIEKKDIIFSYFILYDEQILQADVVNRDHESFTFIHPKTTPIKDEDHDVIFTTEADTRHNYYGRLTKPVNKAVRKLFWYFVANKVFYATNEVGEVVAHYLYWCNNGK
jgi:hypothetical protein